MKCKAIVLQRRDALFVGIKLTQSATRIHGLGIERPEEPEAQQVPATSSIYIHNEDFTESACPDGSSGQLLVQC